MQKTLKNYGRGTGNPHPVDVYVGKRLRQLRARRSLSQEKLADIVDLTFQQLQKYERGANRISASMLWELATALDVSEQYFFKDYDEKKKQGQSPEDAPGWWVNLYFTIDPQLLPDIRTGLNFFAKNCPSSGKVKTPPCPADKSYATSNESVAS